MSIIVSASTKPAPVFAAPGAGHMIAALNLLGAHVALGAVLDVSVLSDPLLKFFITDIGASDPAMSCRTTLHADVLFALGTYRSLLETALLFTNAVAVGSRAPLQIAVHVHIDVLLKLEELFVDFFRAKLFDIFTRVTFLAVWLHAWDFQYFSVFNLSFQVTHLALFAEFMAALETKHIAWQNIIEADET